MSVNEVCCILCISHRSEILCLANAPLRMAHDQAVAVAKETAQILGEIKLSKTFASSDETTGIGSTAAGAEAKNYFLVANSMRRNLQSFILTESFRVTYASFGNYYIVVVSKACCVPSVSLAILDGLLSAVALLQLEHCAYVHRCAEFLLLLEEVIHSCTALEPSDIVDTIQVLMERPLFEPVKEANYSVCDFTSSSGVSTSRRKKNRAGGKEDPMLAAMNMANMMRGMQRPDCVLAESTFSFADDGIPDEHVTSVALDDEIVCQQTAHAKHQVSAAVQLSSLAAKSHEEVPPEEQHRPSVVTQNMEQASSTISSHLSTMGIVSAPEAVVDTVKSKVSNGIQGGINALQNIAQDVIPGVGKSLLIDGNASTATQSAEIAKDDAGSQGQMKAADQDTAQKVEMPVEPSSRQEPSLQHTNNDFPVDEKVDQGLPIVAPGPTEPAKNKVDLFDDIFNDFKPPSSSNQRDTESNIPPSSSISNTNPSGNINANNFFDDWFAPATTTQKTEEKISTTGDGGVKSEGTASLLTHPASLATMDPTTVDLFASTKSEKDRPSEVGSSPTLFSNLAAIANQKLQPQGEETKVKIAAESSLTSGDASGLSLFPEADSKEGNTGGCAALHSSSNVSKSEETEEPQLSLKLEAKNMSTSNATVTVAEFASDDIKMASLDKGLQDIEQEVQDLHRSLRRYQLPNGTFVFPEKLSAQLYEDSMRLLFKLDQRTDLDSAGKVERKRLVNQVQGLQDMVTHNNVQPKEEPFAQNVQQQDEKNSAEAETIMAVQEAEENRNISNPDEALLYSLHFFVESHVVETIQVLVSSKEPLDTAAKHIVGEVKLIAICKQENDEFQPQDLPVCISLQPPPKTEKYSFVVEKCITVEIGSHEEDEEESTIQDVRLSSACIVSRAETSPNHQKYFFDVKVFLFYPSSENPTGISNVFTPSVVLLMYALTPTVPILYPLSLRVRWESENIFDESSGSCSSDEKNSVKKKPSLLPIGVAKTAKVIWSVEDEFYSYKHCRLCMDVDSSLLLPGEEVLSQPKFDVEEKKLVELSSDSDEEEENRKDGKTSVELLHCEWELKPNSSTNGSGGKEAKPIPSMIAARLTLLPSAQQNNEGVMKAFEQVVRGDFALQVKPNVAHSVAGICLQFAIVPSPVESNVASCDFGVTYYAKSGPQYDFWENV